MHVIFLVSGEGVGCSIKTTGSMPSNSNSGATLISMEYRCHEAVISSHWQLLI